MKKLVLISFALFITLVSFSQSSKVNLVVFSDDGDKFYLVINGIRQNIKSETNVRITDLTTESFSFKIIFDDTKIPAISKTQYLPFGNEYTFRIKTDKKGKKAMKPFGQTELSQPTTNTGSTTIIYHTTEEVPVTTSTTTSGTTGTGATVSTNVNGTGTGATSSVGTTGGTKETTTTTTSTTTSTNGGTTTGTTGTTGVGMNVNVNDNTNTGGGTVTTGVNAGGVGINMDVKVTDNGASINMGGTGMGTGTTTTGGTTTSTTGGTGSSSTTTYSSTTTTTTTTSGTGTGVSTNVNTTGNGTTNATNPTGTNSTYTGTSNYACGAAMTTSDFESAKKSISAKSFEDSKLTIAKQVTKANCLSAAQIKEVMGLFDFEATKLEYAKYAYDFCYDKNSYYKLNDAFDFESSVDELNQYIEKK